MSTRYLPSGRGVLASSQPFQFVNANDSIALAKKLLTADSGSPDEVTVDRLDSAKLSFEELSVETAAELGVFFGEAGSSITRRFFVYEYMRFTDIIDPDNNAVVRWGSSARCTLNVKKIEADASINGIAGISASASVNSLNCSVNIEGVGITSGPLSDALPKFSQLDMTTYVALEHAFLKSIPDLMKDDENLNPTLLGVFGEATDLIFEDENLRLAAARTYALTEIAKEYPLSESGYYNGDQAEEAFKRAADIVFKKFTGYSLISNKPTKEMAERAKRILKGIEMERVDEQSR